MNSSQVLFIGRATLDVLYALDHYPSEDTKTFANAMHVAPGGPATNAAITHTLLGGKSQLITTIGGGPWAIPVRDQLQRLGIEVIDLANGTSYETPLVTILVNEPQATRTIVNSPQPGYAFRCPERWDNDWGEPPSRVLTDGFHLPETLPLLRALHAEGVEIYLDGGSWKTATNELASLLSIAICSERFAVPNTPPGADATIAWFVEKGVSQGAITRGAKPIIGWDRGRRLEIEVAQIEAADTTGAGDVLHGAFCYYFAQTGHFEQALRRAAEIATQSCLNLGIRGWRQAPSS